MNTGYKQELVTYMAKFANRLGVLDGYRLLRTGLVKSQVAILMYHRVEPQRNLSFFPYSITVSDFEKQIRYLVGHYQVLSLDELVHSICERRPVSKKSVVITFDDGYKDNYSYAYPILQRYGAHAALFLTTGYIGNGEQPWWDKISSILRHAMYDVLDLGEIGSYSLKSDDERLQAASTIVKRLTGLPEVKRNTLVEEIAKLSGVNMPAGSGRDDMLSWDEVREMSHGGIAIGSHSVTHQMLTALAPEQAKNEIVQSKKTIEEMIDHPVTAFSYPGGRFNDVTSHLLKENGFRCGLTSVPRMVTSESDPYELGRIVAGWTFDVFKVVLCGLYPDLHALISRNKIHDNHKS